MLQFLFFYFISSDVLPPLLKKLQNEEVAQQIETTVQSFANPILIRTMLQSSTSPPPVLSTSSHSYKENIQNYERKLNKNVEKINKLIKLIKKNRIIKYSKVFENILISLEKIQKYLAWWKK